ncbi:YesL family protein, partial [Hominenteromicrobium sp.]
MIPFIVVIALMVGVFLLPIPHFLYATSFFGVLDLYILYAVTLPLILLSPFTCGLAYVTRNFAREEHAFVWSDFWDAVKNNWKPALLNGVIVYLAYVIL